MTYPARRVTSMDDLQRPGDYYGPTQTTDGTRGVWFILPIADPADPLNPFPDTATDRAAWAAKRANGLHRVSEPPWTFRECPDGSIEIRASILCGCGDPEGEYFHGFLDEGHRWRWD